LSVSELKRLRELEAENARLKKMYADLALENEAIKALLHRKLQRRLNAGRQRGSWSGSIGGRLPGPAGPRRFLGRRITGRGLTGQSVLHRSWMRSMRWLRSVPGGASGSASIGCVTRTVAGIRRECIASPASWG
jgi:hypothetical protein